eukprot:CAMPEP_0117427678 /NCGR_PEP_ID=MMETSP0758-20121206/7503_1 /TAXON_ID=63605 /ORGANISM="Percolomonas cosmopolitus, Strain AE-1 (ATCC 50343)" /LENGTH=92 /DNA_ID=CAMNT_0005213509 /DNA_START=49 /DNA_END=327 /DNA_ORIENTATION=-
MTQNKVNFEHQSTSNLQKKEEGSYLFLPSTYLGPPVNNPFEFGLDDGNQPVNSNPTPPTPPPPPQSPSSPKKPSSSSNDGNAITYDLIRHHD